MSSKLQPIRGTKDLLPEEFKIHEYIIKTAQKISGLYGYQPMSTPIVEYAEVFDRTLGKASDVISKEMYCFLDKSNEAIALRPEFTASVIRSFISNGLHHQLPLKFFSYGPLFRYDRPQQGRQRQFHQLNFEYIGASSAYTDAEVIKLADDLLVALNLDSCTSLEINSLGCSESKANYQAKLVEYFTAHKTKLSEDSIKRLEKNPLRILDSKNEEDKKLVKNAPIMSDYYTNTAKEYFHNVLRYLDLLKINYIINPTIVRGLDYYCHTAFEYTTTKLGAQSSVLGGGRYDGLAQIMGGPDTPAFGFAAGIERLALIGKYNLPKIRPVMVLPIGDDLISDGLILTDKLRHLGITVDMDIKSKIVKRMQRAVEDNVRYVIFIGEEEKQQGNFKIKDLDKQQEQILNFEKLVDYIKEGSHLEHPY